MPECAQENSPALYTVHRTGTESKIENDLELQCAPAENTALNTYRTSTLLFNRHETGAPTVTTRIKSERSMVHDAATLFANGQGRPHGDKRATQEVYTTAYCIA